MLLKQEAVDLIKHFEGYRSKPYLCSAGVPTIGYALYRNGADGLTIARTLYTPDDQALFWGIANFWFLDRVIKARSR